MGDIKKPTVSCVMIVKNEGEFLERALESIKGVDELIICDTGSTDGGATVEIAKRYTDKVFTDFTWNDSFCDARNHAKSKATGDWILSLDADEFIHDLSEVYKVIELADADGITAVNVTQIAEGTGQVNYFPRLFKNLPTTKWEGACHNYLNVLGKDMGAVKLTFGYSLAHLGDPNRALRILEKEVKKHGGARETYYLGREYYYKNMFAKATATLGKYVQISKFPAEKAEAFLVMARCYWAQHMGDDARDACLQAININAHFKEALKFMAEISWTANGEQWLRMAETADNRGVLFIRT